MWWSYIKTKLGAWYQYNFRQKVEKKLCFKIEAHKQYFMEFEKIYLDIQ